MDITNATRNFTASVDKGPFRHLLVNPISISIIITIIVVIIIFITDRLSKTVIYIFISTLGLIFIHNRLLLLDHRREICKNDTNNICDSISGSYEALQFIDE
jgi:heme/copper-type cytochrome/quinol oxidase subunit 4